MKEVEQSPPLWLLTLGNKISYEMSDDRADRWSKEFLHSLIRCRYPEIIERDMTHYFLDQTLLVIDALVFDKKNFPKLALQISRTRCAIKIIHDHWDEDRGMFPADTSYVTDIFAESAKYGDKEKYVEKIDFSTSGIVFYADLLRRKIGCDFKTLTDICRLTGMVSHLTFGYDRAKTYNKYGDELISIMGKTRDMWIKRGLDGL